VKSHTASTNPQKTIHETAETLCFQAEMKEVSTKGRLVQKEGSKKLWSTLPTADKLTDFGEGLLREQWISSYNYKICGPRQNKWMLLYDHWKEPSNDASHRDEDMLSAVQKDDSALRDEDMPREVPKFWRVRVVDVCETSKTLTCSCGYFQRVGIPCRHILKVLRTVHGESFAGVTENDVRVFWRKMYYNCAVGIGMDNNDNKLLLTKYFELLDKDTRGPRLAIALDTVREIVDDDMVQKNALSVHERCLNYSKETCLRALPPDLLGGVPANIAQESFVNNSDDDWPLAVLQPSSTVIQSPPPKRGYAVIEPVFKEIAATMTANETSERVAKVHQGLLRVLADLNQDLGVQPPAGRVVSSSVAQSKRQCTHGTGYRKLGEASKSEA
jgi:SWIM zinc finger